MRRYYSNRKIKMKEIIPFDIWKEFNEKLIQRKVRILGNITNIRNDIPRSNVEQSGEAILRDLVSDRERRGGSLEAMEPMGFQLSTGDEAPPQDQALPDDEGPRVIGPNGVVYVGRFFVYSLYIRPECD